MIGIVNKVAEGVFRGARPETASDYLLLQKYGIRTIISLESGWWEWFHREQHHEVLATLRADMIPIRLPTSNFIPPTHEEIEAVMGVLANAEYRPVYVHCRWGHERTGFMIAVYRVLMERRSPEFAINEMLAMGFHGKIYWVWVIFLRQYLKLVAAVDQAVSK